MRKHGLETKFLLSDTGFPDPDFEKALGLFNASGGTALDIGCGTGELSIQLAGRGFSVLGIDVTRDAIDASIENARKAGVHCTFNVLNFLDYDEPIQYDLIVDRGCFTVLGESYDPEYFDNLLRRLKTGGLFLIKSDHSKKKEGKLLALRKFSESNLDRVLEWKTSYVRSDAKELEALFFGGIKAGVGLRGFIAV